MPRKQKWETLDDKQILTGGDLQYSFVGTTRAERGGDRSTRRLHSRRLARSVLKAKN
jgi:hypothetical protein